MSGIPASPKSSAQLNASWEVIQTLDWTAARGVERQPGYGMYLCRIPATMVTDTSGTARAYYIGLAQGHPAGSALPYDILVYTPAELDAFLDGIRNREFDDI